MNANDATLTALTTSQTGNGAADNAPNGPAAASFDLIPGAVAGSALVSVGSPYTLTISAIGLTAVSQGWPTQTMHQAFDAATAGSPAAPAPTTSAPKHSQSPSPAVAPAAHWPTMSCSASPP